MNSIVPYSLFPFTCNSQTNSDVDSVVLKEFDKWERFRLRLVNLWTATNINCLRSLKQQYPLITFEDLNTFAKFKAFHPSTWSQGLYCYFNEPKLLRAPFAVFEKATFEGIYQTLQERFSDKEKTAVDKTTAETQLQFLCGTPNSPLDKAWKALEHFKQEHPKLLTPEDEDTLNKLDYDYTSLKLEQIKYAAFLNTSSISFFTFEEFKSALSARTKNPNLQQHFEYTCLTENYTKIVSQERIFWEDRSRVVGTLADLRDNDPQQYLLLEHIFNNLRKLIEVGQNLNDLTTEEKAVLNQELDSQLKKSCLARDFHENLSKKIQFLCLLAIGDLKLQFSTRLGQCPNNLNWGQLENSEFYQAINYGFTRVPPPRSLFPFRLGNQQNSDLDKHIIHFLDQFADMNSVRSLNRWTATNFDGHDLLHVVKNRFPYLKIDAKTSFPQCMRSYPNTYLHGVYRFFQNYEFPFAYFEETTFTTFHEWLKEKQNANEAEIKKLENMIHDICGDPADPNSPINRAWQEYDQFKKEHLDLGSNLPRLRHLEVRYRSLKAQGEMIQSQIDTLKTELYLAQLSIENFKNALNSKEKCNDIHSDVIQKLITPLVTELNLLKDKTILIDTIFRLKQEQPEIFKKIVENYDKLILLMSKSENDFEPESIQFVDEILNNMFPSPIVVQMSFSNKLCSACSCLIGTILQLTFPKESKIQQSPLPFLLSTQSPPKKREELAKKELYQVLVYAVSCALSQQEELAKK